MNRRNFQDIPPDVHILALDQTWAWQMGAFGDDAQYIKRIDTVVLVDLAEATFICDATPKAYCVSLYYAVVWKDGADVPEEVCERVDEILLEYPGEDDYYLYREIAALVERNSGDPSRHYKVAVDQDDIQAALDDDAEDPQRALMERLREHYTCNHVL